VICHLGITAGVVEAVAAREQEELARRERAYRRDCPAPEFAGRTVILIDDGLATGSSMRAAVAALRLRRPARIVAAVPVAAPEARQALQAEVDEVVCVLAPPLFSAVSVWYRHFPQTSDEEVCRLFEAAARRRSRSCERTTR